MKHLKPFTMNENFVNETKSEKFVVKHIELGYLVDSNQWTKFEEKFSKNIGNAKIYETPKKCLAIIKMITTVGYNIHKDANAERAKMIPTPVAITITEK